MQQHCPVCREWIEEKDYCAHGKNFFKLVKGLKETQSMLKELEEKYNKIVAENWMLKRELEDGEEESEK